MVQCKTGLSIFIKINFFMNCKEKLNKEVFEEKRGIGGEERGGGIVFTRGSSLFWNI
jgi:hypothetical protein